MNNFQPFQCRYTPSVVDFLFQTKNTIALSTYQAGKLVFISAPREDKLVQLPRSFKNPMGIAYRESDQTLALGCKQEIIRFGTSPELARSYPNKPQTYDQIFLPRVTYHTGPLDIHDIAIGSDDHIYAVNTLFSCVMSLDKKYNFRAVWKPPFIDELVPQDRCHLNGMATRDGQPRYVTCLNQGNTPYSWKENPTKGGLLIDIKSEDILLEDLSMPHSPRYRDGLIYYLQSGTGILMRYDVEKKSVETVFQYDGFLRGMDIQGEYALIGFSKIRKKSSSFGKLAIADKARGSGALLVHLTTGSLIGKIMYDNAVDEIYDVKFLAGLQRPNVLNTLSDTYQMAIRSESNNFWIKKKVKHKK